MYQVIFNIDKKDEDKFTDSLFTIGAGSVSTKEISDLEISVMAIFDDIDNVDGLFPKGNYIYHKLEEQVWKYRWLEHYAGFPVNENIYILPVSLSETPPEKYKHIIYLDPRDAFGDGTHPTTSLCLTTLDRICSRFSETEINSINLLDAGTGTGILAILGAKLGIKKIDAVDIDQMSVENASYNAEINNCSQINFKVSDISTYNNSIKYDIITANLLTNIIKLTLSNICSLLTPKGTLIVSGISNMWAKEAEDAFHLNGLIIKEHMAHEGWNCFILSIK